MQQSSLLRWLLMPKNPKLRSPLSRRQSKYAQHYSKSQNRSPLQQIFGEPCPQNALLCHETDAFTRMARLRQSCRGMRPLPDSIYTSAPDGSAGHSRKSCANAEKDVLSRRCLLWEKDSACAYRLTPFWQRTLVQSSLWGDGYFRYVTPLLAGKCFLRMRGC
jgi:hypothetical protein